jgi:hypothetical protein
MLGLWDERAAGTPGDDAPVGVHLTLTASAEPPDTCPVCPAVWEGGGREAPIHIKLRLLSCSGH